MPLKENKIGRWWPEFVRKWAMTELDQVDPPNVRKDELRLLLGDPRMRSVVEGLYPARKPYKGLPKRLKKYDTDDLWLILTEAQIKHYDETAHLRPPLIEFLDWAWSSRAIWRKTQDPEYVIQDKKLIDLKSACGALLTLLKENPQIAQVAIFPKGDSPDITILQRSKLACLEEKLRAIQEYDPFKNMLQEYHYGPEEDLAFFMALEPKHHLNKSVSKNSANAAEKDFVIRYLATVAMKYFNAPHLKEVGITASVLFGLPEGREIDQDKVIDIWRTRPVKGKLLG